MKGSIKLLSVILILASLFGLVGGGVGLKDVMDCKVYWEDKGAKSAADLTTLEDGLNTLKENEQAYYDGLAAYEQGTKDYEQGKQDLADGQKEYDAGKKTLEEKQAEYDQGVKDLKAAEVKLAAGKKTLEENQEAYLAGKEQLKKYEDQYPVAKAFVTNDDGTGKAAYEAVNAYAKGSTDTDEVTAAAVQAAKDVAVPQITKQVKAAYEEPLKQQYTALYNTPENQAAIQAKVQPQIIQEVIASKDDATKAGVIGAYCVENSIPDPSVLTDEQKGQILAGAFIDEITVKVTDAIKEEITQQITDAVTNDITNIVTAEANKQIPDIATNMGTAYSAFVLVGTYEAGMAKIQEYEKGLAEYNAGLDQYYAGKTKLTNGAAQLQEGKDKLEAAGKTIADGKKTLSDAEKQLADGKVKLDEFESGRDQVIDGIGTVLASETYGSLVSIADRLGADFKYVDDKGNLDIEQGLAAVAVAREFSADNSAVVTKELTTRAVAAVLALIAGVLGLVAGVLGLIGTLKAAGVLSAAAAVAAVVGAVVAVVAGSVMSVVAGSAVAAITIAAGAVVAVVGVVSAVVDLKGTKTAA